MCKIKGITIFGMMVLLCNIASATTFIVGDIKGWTYNSVGWPNGKSFKAGDVLVFNYVPKYHNVVVVDKASYGKCTTPEGAKVYYSGHDEITLEKGEHFFICDFPGHCEGGEMKIAVTVT
ncbi:hypothetical protein ACH5RR_001933 [Cinchona calisaya]|uniref:Basic blue protein n=1 Tax=Cinchona calisaya TaxID=153742 RepID=A0ABD3B4U6_9GENT